MKSREFVIKLNLFWKFAFAITSIVIIFGSVNEYITSTNVKDLLEKEYQRRGVYIVNHLASECVQPILLEDYMTLRKEINAIKELDTTILYFFILDARNKVVFHSFENYFPSNLTLANNGSANKQLSIKYFKVKGEDEIILDLAMPLLGGKLGILRLGISENAILSQTKKSVQAFRLMVLFFFITGIAGAFIFAKYITNPIRQLQKIAETLSIRALSSANVPRYNVFNHVFRKFHLPFTTVDEIDMLTVKFNEMIIRLDKAQSENEKAQRSIIHTEKLATLGQMSASLAHEINNPVAGIKNCIKRLSNDTSNISQNVEYLALMNTAVEKIERVAKDYLNFSRFEDVKFENCSVHELVNNVFLFISHRLESREIRISHDVTPPDLQIYCSARHFEQVLINIINNAIDSIEEKTMSDQQCLKEIGLRIYSADNTIVVKIIDSGNGIEPGKMSTIFDPFVTTKDKNKGTGLGLSVVTSILNLHDADITAESKPGTGSTFTIQFPSVIT